ncbi:MAG TPA: hypothetical protein VF219_02165 [Vicinamibacterales bacterium]
MSITRVALASIAAFVAYFAFGFLVFAVAGGPLRREYEKYKSIFRSQDSMKSVMPFGMLAILVAIVVLAILYAYSYRGGSVLAAGAQFGALAGLFIVCTFVIHNYVNLNIGLRLTVLQAIAYFTQWMVVGMVIAAVYRPAPV